MTFVMKCSKVSNTKPIPFCAKHFRETHLPCLRNKAGPAYEQCKGFGPTSAPRPAKTFGSALTGVQKDVDITLLTHCVKQGTHAVHRLGANDIFGTVGCGPCVGFVAPLKTGEVFCAHLDHFVKHEAYQALLSSAESRKAFRVSLENLFPKASDVITVGVASQYSDKEISTFTVECIEQVYRGKLPSSQKFQADNIFVQLAEHKPKIMSEPLFSRVKEAGNAVKKSDGQCHIVQSNDVVIVSVRDEKNLQT
jgi:hypothetical protein